MIAFLLKRCVFAVVEKTDNDEALHFIQKDHLGSWTTITDCQGNIEQELSFDAWGNRRNPETWHSSSQLPEPMFDRGFTGHEHLYAFGLINMNGRMYDPLMSSFLSVDAYVQSPDNSQNFNRYAYCLNNPLKYVDPTGWRMEGGYMGNTTQGPSGWGKNLYPVYEPRDLGLLQLPEYNELAWWREGNKMDGGGSVTIGGNGNPTARVVTDAGHGIRGKNDKYMDHGACNGEYYESDFALLIEHSLSKWLIAFGISTERTRENEIVVNDNRINYRWKLANEAGAEVFISIHLDFDAKETAFAVYEQRGPNQKWQEENSIELANYIMQNMTIVLPADESIIPSTKTNHGTIGVLKCFKGEAGVLLEMGGIGSEANRNNIINNHDMIGRQIATGVYQYLNDGALPPSRLSWFYKCTFY